jgi:hypothetical protein
MAAITAYRQSILGHLDPLGITGHRRPPRRRPGAVAAIPADQAMLIG